MKKYIYITLLMLITTSINAEVIDRIVAKVGSEIILKSELQEHRNQMQQMGAIDHTFSDLELLNDMIESQLILQTAKDKDYQVDSFRIRQMINSQLEEQFQRFGSERAFREELRRTGMSLSQLRDFYENMIKEQQLREMIIQNEISARISVSDMEIEEFYRENIDQLPLREEKTEIGLIRIDITPKDETVRQIRSEINEVYDKIREGQDFSQLAQQYSHCPSSRLGGDLGFFARGTMISEFEQVAFSLQPGEISNVVETAHGYHIIKMEERDEDDIRVRHILKMLKPTEQDIAETTEKAENILNRISAEEEFSEIARNYSDHPTAQACGYLGEFNEEEYPEQFEDYLQEISVGEVTRPIRAENSIYILTKKRIIPQRPFRLEEIREELREHLRMEKKLEHYEQWIGELREDSYVEILL